MTMTTVVSREGESGGLSGGVRVGFYYIERDDERRGGGDGYENFTMLSTTSEQARLPAEFKHIIKRRKRN